MEAFAKQITGKGLQISRKRAFKISFFDVDEGVLLVFLQDVVHSMI